MTDTARMPPVSGADDDELDGDEEFFLDENVHNADWPKRHWDLSGPPEEQIGIILGPAQGHQAQQEALDAFMQRPVAAAMPDAIARALIDRGFKLDRGNHIDAAGDPPSADVQEAASADVQAPQAQDRDDDDDESDDGAVAAARQDGDDVTGLDQRAPAVYGDLLRQHDVQVRSHPGPLDSEFPSPGREATTRYDFAGRTAHVGTGRDAHRALLRGHGHAVNHALGRGTAGAAARPEQEQRAMRSDFQSIFAANHENEALPPHMRQSVTTMFADGFAWYHDQPAQLKRIAPDLAAFFAALPQEAQQQLPSDDAAAAAGKGEGDEQR